VNSAVKPALWRYLKNEFILWNNKLITATKAHKLPQFMAVESGIAYRTEGDNQGTTFRHWANNPGDHGVVCFLPRIASPVLVFDSHVALGSRLPRKLTFRHAKTILLDLRNECPLVGLLRSEGKP
jgi:hypothetical protein